jgi:hypothetical protein
MTRAGVKDAGSWAQLEPVEVARPNRSQKLNAGSSKKSAAAL